MMPLVLPVGSSVLKAAILTIGTEITTGRTIDAHGPYVAQQLLHRGYRVEEILAVPDSPLLIEDSITRLMNLYSLVITTGGLGPTTDDITLSVIERYLQKVSPKTTVQSLPNEVGLAPGVLVPINGTLLVALPGPVAELRPMFSEQVLPRLPEYHSLSVPTLLVLSCIGIPESHIDRWLQSTTRDQNSSIKWSISLGAYRTEVVLSNAPAASLRNLYTHMQKHFGVWHVHEGVVDISQVVVQELIARNLWVACAESCTGGLLSSHLTAVPQASKVLWGSTILYSVAAKEWFGLSKEEIKNGTVSKEVTQACAQRVLGHSGADIGVAITGVAGPTKDERNQEIGRYYIAVANRSGVKSYSEVARGTRVVIQRKVTIQALLRLLYSMD